MSQSQESKADAAQQRSEETRSFVRTVKAATRRRYTPEEKIRVVLEGFRREVTVNDLCRREGIKPHSYYAWTKEFMEAGKERLTRETVAGTPRARRSSNSGVTTTSSSNWWPTCPWRSTVSKNGYPSACRRRRYQRMSAFEKTTVLARVASSTLPKRQVLKDLGVPKSTYYRWLTREQRCQGLENQPGGGLAPWNRPLSQPEEQAVLTVARRAPELSCRQLAAWITDNQGFSVSESTVYRILRREGLVKSPEMQLKAGKEYHRKTTGPNQM